MMSLFFYRVMGAAMLDASMYEGIEGDRSVTGQAAAAVLLSEPRGGHWRRRVVHRRAADLRDVQHHRSRDLALLGRLDVSDRDADIA